MTKKFKFRLLGLALLLCCTISTMYLKAQDFEPPMLLGCQYTGNPFTECDWGDWVIVEGCRNNPLGNNCTIGYIPDPVEPN